MELLPKNNYICDSRTLEICMYVNPVAVCPSSFDHKMIYFYVSFFFFFFCKYANILVLIPHETPNDFWEKPVGPQNLD